MMEKQNKGKMVMYKNSVSCSLTDKQLTSESNVGWLMFKTVAWERWTEVLIPADSDAAVAE